MTETRIAIRAGRKVGKSFLAAILALWWPVRYPDGRVIITATTDRQVRGIIWRDIRRLIRQSQGYEWPHQAKIPSVGIQWEDGRAIEGYTASTAEGAAGTSGAHLLFIVDEASGVEDYIFHTLLGNMAGGGTLVMISNPTRPGGFFYDAFNSRAALWRTYKISSRESPNVLSGTADFPGMATRDWVDEMAEAWGRGTALYQVHVEGEFPAQADDCIIPLGDVLAGIERYKAECDERGELQWDEHDGPLELGVDVARFGDDESVIAARRGRKLLALVPVRNADGPTLAARVSRLAAELNRGPVDARPLVKVDIIGVGASVFDFLARDSSLRVVGVNVAESATDSERFANRRAELWHHLARWLRNGGAIPDDSKLQAELAAPRYDYSDPKGRMRVEAKDQFKRRLNRSPDRADAVALAVYELSPGPLCFALDEAAHRARTTSSTAYRMGAGRGF